MDLHSPDQTPQNDSSLSSGNLPPVPSGSSHSGPAGSSPATGAIPLSSLKPGSVVDLGTVELSEQDIIDFGKRYDPLPIHVDPVAAKQSRFGQLIASGAQLFNHFYRTSWIPKFADSTVCGVGLTDWNYFKPVLANEKIDAQVTVLSMNDSPSGKHSMVSWHWEFRDSGGDVLQELTLKILHSR